jgi:uncharacterized protein YceK
MRIMISIFLALVLLSGCSSKPSIELLSSSVQISDDRAGGIVTHKDNQEKTIKPLSLSYTFTLKNTGNSVGSASKINNNFEYVNGIKATIVPNEKLTVVSNEVLGFNLYGQEKTLGLGKTASPILGKNQQAEYTFDYLLGAKEDYPEIKSAPSEENLNKLLINALDAILIVSIEEKEIARFDLSKSK